MSFLPPKWLPIHTDCNWRSNVLLVCHQKQAFGLDRTKLYYFHLFSPIAKNESHWSWQSCRGEQKNQNLFFMMTEPFLSCYLELLKHLFGCRGKKNGASAFPAEPCGHLRSCCIKPLTTCPSRVSQLPYPHLLAASWPSVVVLICFLTSSKATPDFLFLNKSSYHFPSFIPRL